MLRLLMQSETKTHNQTPFWLAILSSPVKLCSGTVIKISLAILHSDTPAEPQGIHLCIVYVCVVQPTLSKDWE